MKEEEGGEEERRKGRRGERRRGGREGKGGGTEGRTVGLTHHPRQGLTVQGGVGCVQGAQSQVLRLEQLIPLALVCGGTPAQDVFLGCPIEQSAPCTTSIPRPFPSGSGLTSSKVLDSWTPGQLCTRLRTDRFTFKAQRGSEWWGHKWTTCPALKMKPRGLRPRAALWKEGWVTWATVTRSCRFPHTEHLGTASHISAPG